MAKKVTKMDLDMHEDKVRAGRLGARKRKYKRGKILNKHRHDK
jgi:hypothetical protein